MSALIQYIQGTKYVTLDCSKMQTAIDGEQTGNLVFLSGKNIEIRKKN